VIRETFEQGRLSYSKVRAITRVATTANAATMVKTALDTTAAQLERIVTAMRTATREQVRDRHDRRELTWRWDDDGMLVLSVRLDPDEGAITLAALRAARCAEPKGSTTTRADAFAAVMAFYLASAVRDADDSEAFQIIVVTDPQTLAGTTAEGTEAPGTADAAGAASHPDTSSTAADAGFASTGYGSRNGDSCASGDGNAHSCASADGSGDSGAPGG
jgi:hypothetical protein